MNTQFTGTSEENRLEARRLLDAAKQKLYLADGNLDVVAAVKSSADRAMTLHPDLADAYYLSAICSVFQLGEHDEVLDLLQAAVSRAPADAGLRLTYARVLRAVGHPDARKQLRQVISDEPTNQSARDLLDRTDFDAHLASREDLKGVAADALARWSPAVVVTPWVRSVPPWKWVWKKPLIASCVLALCLFLLAAVTVYPDLSWNRAIQRLVLCMGIFCGLYFPFLAARQLEKVYETLKNISRLQHDTLARWFNERMSSLCGSINLRPAETRGDYSVRDLLRKDRVLFGWWLFWTVVMSICALAVTGSLKPAATADWGMRSLLSVLFAYTWVWSGHFVVYSLSFIRELGRLPVHYFFGMPPSVSFKAIGARFVTMAWLSTPHFWALSVALVTWQSGEQHNVPAATPSEATAPQIASLFIVALYFVWTMIWVLGTQAVLSFTMMKYKERRWVEYSYHLEELFEKFLEQPGDDSFAQLNNGQNHGKAILGRLPTLSLGVKSFASFGLLVAVDLLVLWQVVYHSGLHCYS